MRMARRGEDDAGCGASRSRFGVRRVSASHAGHRRARTRPRTRSTWLPRPLTSAVPRVSRRIKVRIRSAVDRLSDRKKTNFSIFPTRILRRCHHSNLRSHLGASRKPRPSGRCAQSLEPPWETSGGSRSGRRGAVRGFRSITSRSVGFSRRSRVGGAPGGGHPPVGQQPAPPDWVG